MHKKIIKIMVWLILPLFFLVIGYGLMYIVAQPYIRPLASIYHMVAQNQAPDFSNETKDLYANKTGLPESGEISIKDIPSVVINDTIGRVIVEDVGIDVPLIYGSNEDCLYVGVGLRVQSKKPGYGKPVMIAGHTIPYFKNLGNVEIGQVICIKTYYGIFKYRITGTRVANASDTSAYDLTQNKEQLILFTCYPLDGVGEKEDRLFVYADKISGPIVVGDTDE